MKFHYDKKTDALSIRFNDAVYGETEEIRDGIFFDYDQKGKIIGIEVLDASAILPKDIKTVELATSLPISVRVA